MLLQNTLAMPGYILIAKSFLSKITQKKQAWEMLLRIPSAELGMYYGLFWWVMDSSSSRAAPTTPCCSGIGQCLLILVNLNYWFNLCPLRVSARKHAFIHTGYLKQEAAPGSLNSWSNTRAFVAHIWSYTDLHTSYRHFLHDLTIWGRHT